MIICHSFTEYLNAITNQVRLHGKDSLSSCDDPKSLRCGFKTPSEVIYIGLNHIKAFFSTNEFRENTEVIGLYKKFGGKTEIRCLTRLPPMEEFLSLYKKEIVNAINKGMNHVD